MADYTIANDIAYWNDTISTIAKCVKILTEFGYFNIKIQLKRQLND